MATLMERKYKMMLLAWVGPVQAQVDSDKLTNECIAMHKCTKTKKFGNVKEAFRHRYFLKHCAVYFEDVNLNCDPRVGFE